MDPVQHNPARLRAKSQLDSINVLAQVHALYPFKICVKARYILAVCCHYYTSGCSSPFVWLAVIPRLGRLFLLGRAWSGLPITSYMMERDRKMRGAASTGAYNRPQIWEFTMDLKQIM